MACVLVFCNQKGGTGKTTVCRQVGSCLSGRVLFVDVDPQANLSSQFLSDIKGYTLVDLFVLAKEGELNAIDVYRAVYSTGVDGVDVIPSHRNLVSFETVSDIGREKYLTQVLDFVASDYDYVLIDTPPSIGMLTVNALVSADEVLVVTEPRKSSVDGVEQMIRTLKLIRANYNQNLNLNSIIINKHTNTLDASKWSEYLHETYTDLVASPVINQREHYNKQNTTPTTLKPTIQIKDLTRHIQNTITKH